MIRIKAISAYEVELKEMVFVKLLIAINLPGISSFT